MLVEQRPEDNEHREICSSPDIRHTLVGPASRGLHNPLAGRCLSVCKGRESNALFLVRNKALL